MGKKWKSAITGALAGLANGFFGSGGGLFLVPLLTHWLRLDERKAFATSIGIILPLSLLSAFTYFWKGAIDFQAALPFLIGGAAGGVLSGWLFQKVPMRALRRIFALLILYGGVKALFGF